MVPRLVLWSPLKVFFDQFENFFYASNGFRTIGNVFFHQNNPFELIERRFEKIFFQWSPFGAMVTP